jgi:LuxR family transcriptional regulator, maltose regulon positive regulatory protein
LRHCLLIRHWPEDPQVQKDAQAWLRQSGIVFDKLAVIHSVDPMSTAYFERYLGAAHVVARLAAEKVSVYPIDAVHDFLRRQAEFAATHGIASWVVAIAITRILLYHAEGKKSRALATLAEALRAGAPTGFHRVFLDECLPLHSLLEELKPQLSDDVLIKFVDHLLGAMDCQPSKLHGDNKHETLLSEREVEVLHYLARGFSYEETGKQLFLSLNTVQFHVKNIYGKLQVNKRVQAIEKAREMNLI